MNDLADTGNLGCSSCHVACAFASHQDVYVAAKLCSCGNNFVGRVVQGRIVVFSNNQNSH